MSNAADTQTTFHTTDLPVNEMAHSERCTNAAYEAIVGHEAPTLLLYGTSLLSALTDAGWTYDALWECPPKTMKQLQRNLTSMEAGTYYIMTAGHAMAIHDGELIDHSGRGFDGRHIKGIFRLTRVAA